MVTTFSAAINNAEWCNLVCSLHGAPGEFYDTFWINPGLAPPLYPNFVATDPSGTDVHMRCIKRLITEVPERSFAIKDSFQMLDLASLGFKLLSEAEWYRYTPLPHLLPSVEAQFGWRRVKSVAGLQEWEIAWRFANDLEDVEPRPFFPPQLLLRKNVSILAYRERRSIRAGAIAFRTQETIGLTNFFSLADTRLAQFVACLTFISRKYPGFDIVGYEETGFGSQFETTTVSATGPLRIWLKASSTTSS